MPTFVHPLWGYALDYPAHWVWREEGEVVAFAPHAAALDLTYEGQGMGHVVIRPELNPYLRPVEPLWTQYITRIAIMRGAKNMGSAPLKVGRLQGYEAELQLPQKANRRLWVGLLAAGGVVLHLLVTHRRDEKDLFQVPASRLVQSLRFVARTPEVPTTPWGAPLPPGYTPTAPQDLLTDAPPEQGWEAYRGAAPIAALQAFYLRELPAHGWTLETYFPFPNRDPKVRFAALAAQREHTRLTVALLPYGQDPVLGQVALRRSEAPSPHTEV